MGATVSALEAPDNVAGTHIPVVTTFVKPAAYEEVFVLGYVQGEHRVSMNTFVSTTNTNHDCTEYVDAAAYTTNLNTP